MPWKVLYHLYFCLVDDFYKIFEPILNKRVVCSKNKRIFNHKVFKDIAKRGRNSMGYFFGFKLHLLVNQIGQIIHFNLTPGNGDDRKSLIPILKNFKGKIFGDKGYIGKEFFTKLFKNGIHFITSLRL